MNDLTFDYLPNHQDIHLYQHKKMFRINTDTCLLGEFLDFEDDLEVLDIGTNNRALLLYASLLKPKMMVGIDINNDALLLADKNLKLNNISNYELINIDVKDYHKSFDIIISNPPYFVSSEDLKNKNEYLKMARHEEYLSLGELIKFVKGNLKGNGYFYLVHRYSRYKEIIRELSKHNLYIKKEKIVYDQNKVEPITILLKISFREKEKISETILISR